MNVILRNLCWFFPWKWVTFTVGLFEAAERGAISVLHWLLEKGAKTNVQDGQWYLIHTEYPSFPLYSSHLFKAAASLMHMLHFDSSLYLVYSCFSLSSKKFLTAMKLFSEMSSSSYYLEPLITWLLQVYSGNISYKYPSLFSSLLSANLMVKICLNLPCMLKGIIYVMQCWWLPKLSNDWTWNCSYPICGTALTQTKMHRLCFSNIWLNK